MSKNVCVCLLSVCVYVCMCVACVCVFVRVCVFLLFFCVFACIFECLLFACVFVVCVCVSVCLCACLSVSANMFFVHMKLEGLSGGVKREVIVKALSGTTSKAIVTLLFFHVKQDSPAAKQSRL